MLSSLSPQPQRFVAGSALLLLASCVLALALPSQAAVIYRWVDEQGRTHFSDVVPEKYRQTATRIESSGSEVSPERKRQAEEQAAREKAPADEAARRRQSAQVPSSAPLPPAGAKAKRPAQSVTESTDCETWRRLYRESEECFAPYRTTRGATKAEAYEKCNPIPSPVVKCGPISE